jgi:tetratricopeptide (TPR) repeat protein
VQERIESYQSLIEDKYPAHRGEIASDHYLEIMTPLMLDNTEADLAIGRMTLAQRDLERVLSRQPANARAHFLLGETYRQRKEPGDVERSESHYQDAIHADPRLSDPHRALGYSLLKRGDALQGKTELQKYLELSPLAPDRPYVEQALKELS